MINIKQNYLGYLGIIETKQMSYIDSFKNKVTCELFANKS